MLYFAIRMYTSGEMSASGRSRISDCFLLFEWRVCCVVLDISNVELSQMLTAEILIIILSGPITQTDAHARCALPYRWAKLITARTTRDG